MKYLALMLLAGCAMTPTGGDYCDLSGPMYFDTADTINWLADNDPTLLKQIITNNEVNKALCR